MKYTWSAVKPKFKEECLLITATKIREKWEYNSWLIVKVYGEGGWYWGWCTLDGEEYDDIAEMVADKYLTIKLLK